MAGDVTPLYAATRRALLDALDALVEQRDALILVGAQAVFLRTREVDEAIATETKDADLAIVPALLADDPSLEEALKGAGFHLDLEHPQPGSWLSPRGYPVDVLLPEAVSGRLGAGRSGRIPPHDKMAARRVRGIEGAIVDHAPMTVSALEPDDARRYHINVAGPAALLVAKLHKVAEREQQAGRRRPRDAHDVFRLLRDVDVRDFVSGFAVMKASAVSAEVTREAINHLEALFGEPGDSGAQQAAAAVAPLVEDPQLTAVRCAVLAREVLQAIG